MVEEPVTITYEKPRERVLFNAARDASPFLHLYEALHMLAGREDVAPLAYYAKNFLNYSDDGVTLNGAYGYRWRHADTSVEERDQLEIIIEHLKNKPESRRPVLQMWNVEDDLMNIDESKDVCCNLSVMFSIRGATGGHRTDTPCNKFLCLPEQNPLHYWHNYLDMTVTNRSNDMIWGTLGANIVHFSILQEYMAAHLGVEVGVYNQFTNNLHVYENNWKPDEWLAWVPHGSPPSVETIPLVADPVVFDKEMPEFVNVYWGSATENNRLLQNDLVDPFLSEVAQPMLSAFMYYKEGNFSQAIHASNCVKADDWRYAAQGWLERRINKKGKTNAWWNA